MGGFEVRSLRSYVDLLTHAAETVESGTRKTLHFELLYSSLTESSYLVLLNPGHSIREVEMFEQSRGTDDRLALRWV